jgi:hypothetical protein
MPGAIGPMQSGSYQVVEALPAENRQRSLDLQRRQLDALVRPQPAQEMLGHYLRY